MNILDQETILLLFHNHSLFFIGSLFAITFAFTYYLIPKVLWVSNEKNLTATVNDRSAHNSETPSLGGVAFFITLILVLSLIQNLRLTYVGNHIIGAITILFMVGLKDDLVISTARVKLFGQIFATCFIVFSPELQLTNLHGFWGIHEIPHTLGYIFSGILVVGIINAYNLIDGIDGLASMVGIVIAGVYGVIFYETGNSYFVLVCVCVMGILSGFLRFNFSRGRRKIFMGDSGSLVIGLLIALFTLKVLVMKPVPVLLEAGYLPANRLLLIACVLFLPLFDTLRVMLIRMINKKSPFSADRNHAHHVLLDLGFNHFRTSLILVCTNLIVILIFVYFCTSLTHSWLSFVIVGIYSSAFLLLTQLKILSEKTARPTYSYTANWLRPPGGVKVRKEEEPVES